MKKLMITVLIAGFVAAPAVAGELEDHCVGFTTVTTGDSSGCSCLASKADETMTEELMAVAAEADLETLSQASQDAIATCWPDAA